METLGAPTETLELEPAAHHGTGWWSLRRIGVVLLIVGITVLAAGAGLRLRHDVWFHTEGVHFEGDVANGFNWGRSANGVGLFNLYDKLAKGQLFRSKTELDYTPLRLAAVAAWAQWAHVHYPKVTYWNDEYDLTLPMLRANTAAELLSSLLIFVLIRMWVIRMDDANRASRADEESPRAFRGVAQGMTGALIFWFNPAIIWDGHIWPQWDVWLVPFFLAALLLACVDWWFAAGVCLTIGALLKGQMLLGAPILLLWPICQLRFGAVLRLIAGFLTAMAVCVFPWLNLVQGAIIWYVLALASLGLLAPLALRWNVRRAWHVLVLAFIAAMLAWPWHSDAPIRWRVLPMAFLAMVVLCRFLPPRLLPHCYALAVTGAAFLLIPLFEASTTWFTIGFGNGVDKYGEMLSGNGVFNLPALMRAGYRWPIRPEDPTVLPLVGTEVPFRTAMVILYGICLLLCAIGAAIHYRRRDTRFLVAMAAPWVIFYCVMTQMHGRYLIWGAAMSALLAGAGWGLAALAVLVSFIGMLGMAYNQYVFVPDWDPEHFRTLQHLVPNLGWMLLLAALIYLYNAVTPRTSATLT